MHDLTALVPAHTEPWFDLAEEPWIPVRRGDATTSVGLAEALYQAHVIDDLACDDLLEEHTIWRLLTAFVAAMHAAYPDEDWDDVADGAPIPEEAVGWLLRRLRPHLWLRHPESPFLQLPQLRTAARTAKSDSDLRKVLHPTTTLWPHIPASSNESWWNRDVDPEAPAELARGLLVRHFAASPGNELDIASHSETENTEVARYTAGGVVLAGPRDASFVRWQDQTLAASLLRNIPEEVLDAAEATAEPTFFWEAPLDPVRHLADPLYKLTASAAASYLVWTEDRVLVVRGRVPVKRSDSATLMDQARLHDPMALRVAKKTDRYPHTLSEVTGVVLPPAVSELAVVSSYWDRIEDRPLQPCPLTREKLRYKPSRTTPLRAITILTGGTSTGVRVDTVSAVTLRSGELLTLPEDRAAELRRLLKLVDSRSGSTVSVLTYYAAEAVGDSSDRELRGQLRRAIQQGLWARLEPVVAPIALRIAAGSEAGELDEATLSAWRKAASATFDEVVRPYASGPRAAARVAENRVAARRSLWSRLSSTY